MCFYLGSQYLSKKRMDCGSDFSWRKCWVECKDWHVLYGCGVQFLCYRYQHVVVPLTILSTTNSFPALPRRPGRVRRETSLPPSVSVQPSHRAHPWYCQGLQVGLMSASQSQIQELRKHYCEFHIWYSKEFLVLRVQIFFSNSLFWLHRNFKEFRAIYLLCSSLKSFMNFFFFFLEPPVNTNDIQENQNLIFVWLRDGQLSY